MAASGVVGVHVDDRRVETLGEVARVAGGAAFVRVGREADLVVGDQMQRAAGRVAGKPLEVERLGDDALPGKRGVTVDEDRQRDGRAVAAGGGRAVGLLRARPALDHRVDGLEVARVGDERDRDLARLGLADALRAEVVLHVTGAALGTADDRIRHALSLELAEDRLVGLAQRVREHAEAAAVRHAHDDPVRALARRELDRLVEHRHERVQPLDGELLLAEERPAEVLLERLDGRQPLEQPSLLLRGERLAELARLDRPAQPSPLLMVGDVLDLVRDRPAVRLLEQRQRLGERLGGNVQAEQRRPGSGAGARAAGASQRDRGRAPGRRSAPSRAGRGVLRARHACGRRRRATSPPPRRPAGPASAPGQVAAGAAAGAGGRSAAQVPGAGSAGAAGAGASWAATRSASSSRHSSGTASGFSR